MSTVKVKKSQIKPILEATFPEYRGRTFKISFTTHVTFYNTNWGGGSRNEYKAVRIDGKIADIPVLAPWNNPIEGKRVELPADVLVVEHSMFCGTDCGITIHSHPCNAPRWIEGE